METERIVAAAIRLDDGTTHTKPPPARHPSLIYDVQAEDPPRIIGHVQGFVTSTGRFVTRQEAWGLAENAGQLLPKERGGFLSGTLYSEDVW